MSTIDASLNHPIQRQAVTIDWKQSLKEDQCGSVTDSRHYWNTGPETLLSKGSVAHQLAFGTGQSIFEDLIIPAIEHAENEVIIITCFWARSPTLDALSNALLNLSARATRAGKIIRIRIGFSSSSLFQKLFHTTSLAGKTWPSSKWHSSLGLPKPEHLSGLDMEVKSVFVLPFSVMHPKFILVDRTRVILPSCNISWENWFEGCIDLGGPIVQQFVRFWSAFWANERDQAEAWEHSTPTLRHSIDATVHPTLLAHHHTALHDLDSLFLPSPHHRNPRFALPWRACPPPPSTPLNAFIVSALRTTSRNIYIQTPNLTAPPVLSGILKALGRGINVVILTSERLMILEQYITAGTTTQRCVRKLIRRYKALVNSTRAADLESGTPGQPGRLTVKFFTPVDDASTTPAEPVQSHLKLTIFDDEWTVLGSGNMDRASWYTSQELGVAFFSPELTGAVRVMVDEAMRPRSRVVYDSG